MASFTYQTTQLEDTVIRAEVASENGDRQRVGQPQISEQEWFTLVASAAIGTRVRNWLQDHAASFVQAFMSAPADKQTAALASLGLDIPEVTSQPAVAEPQPTAVGEPTAPTPPSFAVPPSEA